MRGLWLKFGGVAISSLALMMVSAPGAYAGAYCVDTFSFSSATYSVQEGQAVTITVTDHHEVYSPSNCASTTATVDYATSDGTAHSPGDYQATNGTLTFNGGSTTQTLTQTFTVQTVDNGRPTGDLNFNVALSNPTASGGTYATVGSPSSATVTIHNTDSGPVATTQGHSGVTPTSATVKGSVNPHGVATTYHFEYGTSSAYGETTSSKSAGSSQTAQNVSAHLTGLRPGTTYHYRVVATSSAGTSTGADRTFTTAKPPFAGAFAPTQTDKMNQSGYVEVKVVCPAGTAGACAGTLTITYNGTTISDPSFRAGSGRTVHVRVHLTPHGQSLVRAHGRLDTHAVVKSHDRYGTRRTRVSRVTIVAPASAPSFTG